MKFVSRASILIPETTFSGKNHSECLGKVKRNSIQGFIIDDYDRSYFAGRKEALEIAKKRGQIVEKHSPKDQLLSEDMMWDEEKQRFLVGSEIKK